MAAAALVVAIVSAVAAVVAARAAIGERDRAAEANRIAAAANQTAGAAVRTAQEANALTVAANETAAAALEIARRMRAIEEERRAVERAREEADARAQAEAVVEVYCNHDVLVITNESERATARNIVVVVVEVVGGNRPPRLRDSYNVADLRPGKSAQSEPFARVMGMASAIEVQILWQDGLGDRQTYRTVPLHR